jgi:CubicO group peptidase (beta-lactamase class C family)
MKIKTLVTSLILLSIFILSCTGQSNSNSLSTDTNQQKKRQLDELISTYTNYGKFNGSVLVSYEGEVLYKNGFGFANMEWGNPNAADTKHRIASITKQFTAMLIMQLVAENRLDLQVPISTYLPDYPKETAERVTIHHLLTHTSGIPDYGRFSNYRSFERNRHSPQQIVDLFADLPLESTPGEEYSYCNSGYVLLGVIIENVTQKRYAEVLQEKILTPLGMENTGYDDQWSILKNRASGYYKIWGQYRNMNYLDMSLPYAAGSLYSTVEDLHIWDQALYTEQLVPQAYLDMIFQPYAPARSRHYGYGWFISELAKGNTGEHVASVSHGGGMDGFRTLITRVPSSKSAIILLSNTESQELREMTIAINGILYGQPYDLPKKSIAYALLEVIEKNGATEGIAFFKKTKDDNNYYTEEQEMVIVGYQLLEKNRAKDAATVFELAIQVFPNAFNVYDSYGEVLMALGENAKAIENYQKSIELNPDNENGKRKLEELGAN